jgi:hypothetical protein
MRAAWSVASLSPVTGEHCPRGYSPNRRRWAPLQVAERSLTIGTPDSTTTYGCITTGMHPGKGIVGLDTTR